MSEETVISKKSDLGIRTASATVMISVVVAAFWFDGYPLIIFIGLVSLELLWEFWGLVTKISDSLPSRIVWMLGGTIYIGMGGFMLLLWSSPFYDRTPALVIIGAVIATDIGAYFTGRTLGGPKIAPLISPSKTWSGLLGGMVAAGIFVLGLTWWINGSSVIGNYPPIIEPKWFIMGALIAVVAQIGDFFESWMKRRAGVKDSGKLIPGHGGLFDRTDGMLAVLFVSGLAMFSQLYSS